MLLLCLTRFVAFCFLFGVYVTRVAFDWAVVWPLTALLHHTRLRRIPKIVRTPEERFMDLEGFPFAPHFLTINGMRIHYVDEGPPGAEEVILMLHGEPSWSYLYRKMIPPIAEAGHRAIAMDFVGFGRSDKYTETKMYTHEMHCSTLRQLIERLDLRNITIVCQDWGGKFGGRVVGSCWVPIVVVVCCMNYHSTTGDVVQIRHMNNFWNA